MLSIPATFAPPPRPLDYPAILGNAWRNLPAATRRRFLRHDATFVGSMTLHASACGRWLARLLRPFGSPLPPASTVPVPATVRVEPDPKTGGSRWIRRYEFPRGAVEIRSVKAHERDGGLVERLALGLRMPLTVAVRDGELHFLSTGYYFEWLGLRVPLPSWFPPGCTHVVHRDLGDGRFRFTMTVRHAWLGELFNHDGIFWAEGG